MANEHDAVANIASCDPVRIAASRRAVRASPFPAIGALY